MKTKKYECYAIRAQDKKLDGFLVLTDDQGIMSPLLFVSEEMAKQQLKTYKKVIRDTLSVVPVTVKVKLSKPKNNS